MKSQINWENLHSKKRFRPQSPAESIVKFLFTNFSHDWNEKEIVDYYPEFSKVEYIKNNLYNKGLSSKGSNWI